MLISLFQIDISNQLQISLELEVDISNAVIGLSNTDICNKRVLPQLIYLREREIKMIGRILFSVMVGTLPIWTWCFMFNLFLLSVLHLSLINSALKDVSFSKFTYIFSSPEQSSWRAIVLPPASALALALALASASTNVSFTLKFLGPHYFQTLWWIWFIFGMMIDTGPKFYSVPSPPPCMTLRSRSRT